MFPLSLILFYCIFANEINRKLKMCFRLAILCILATCYIGAKAQSVVVKTNILYDVLGVASLGVEATVSKLSL